MYEVKEGGTVFFCKQKTEDEIASCRVGAERGIRDRKEGGNNFTGGFNGLYTGNSMQGDNLSDALRARGLTTVTHLRYVFDTGGTLAGPIKKDRLWFYFSLRYWGNERQAAGKFFNATQGTPFYTPDPSRPAYQHEWYESKATRVTWRASERNKFNFFADPQRDCHCPQSVASGGD